MNKYIIISILLLTFNSGCRVTRQGITGQVTWYEGNRMPGTGKELPPGKPVQREIFIYAPTTRVQAVSGNGIFYSDIRTKMIKHLRTGRDGKFFVKLPEGEYSVFIKEEKGLYANRLDGKGYINLVRVRKGKKTSLQIFIDYRAAY